jgi:hypothetical protein
VFRDRQEVLVKHLVVLLAFVAGALPVAALQPYPFGPSTAEFRVNTYTTASPADPAITIYGPLGFTVVWWGDDATDPSPGGIFGQRFSFTDPSGTQFHVNTYVTNVQYAPRIGGLPYASAPGTQFVVTWTSRTQDGDAAGVFARRYGALGPLGAEFQVNVHTTDYELDSDVAIATNGDFVIVWAQPDADIGGIFARRYAANGDPQGGVFRVNVVTTGYQRFPAVARSSSGDFVVVWQSYQEFGTANDIVARRFSSSGDPLTGDFLVEATTNENHVHPSVAALGVDAGYVVVWESVPAGNTQIFGRRFDAAGTPSAAFHVDTAGTYSHYSPAVGGDSDGNFVVVWNAFGIDGSGFGIVGRRYDASGASLGAEFRVNTHTTADQVLPRVAMTAGGFVVTWQGASEIKARQYCYLAGDADGSGVIDLSDVFYLINNLFASGPAPVHASDFNGDGNLDVADVFAMINFLFAGGPAPVCAPAG